MSKRILIIDDQEIERTACRSILQAEPTWQVVDAESGQHALDLLCSGYRPHLCLVDLRMPNMSGVEFLQRVRRDRDLRGLKAMVISASRDRDTILELAKLGIAGYVLKPFDPEKLLAGLRPVMAAVPDEPDTPVVLRDLLTKTALVVDDDPVARAALTAIIKTERHWQTVEVADAESALNHLRSGARTDYGFIDLQMPGMDGIALLNVIRSEPALQALRVAVTSGVRDRERIVALAQLRIDTYLLKPLDRDKVLAVLRALF